MLFDGFFFALAILLKVTSFFFYFGKKTIPPFFSKPQTAPASESHKTALLTTLALLDIGLSVGIIGAIRARACYSSTEKNGDIFLSNLAAPVLRAKK